MIATLLFAPLPKIGTAAPLVQKNSCRQISTWQSRTIESSMQSEKWETSRCDVFPLLERTARCEALSHWETWPSKRSRIKNSPTRSKTFRKALPSGPECSAELYFSAREEGR